MRTKTLLPKSIRRSLKTSLNIVDFSGIVCTYVYTVSMLLSERYKKPKRGKIPSNLFRIFLLSPFGSKKGFEKSPGISPFLFLTPDFRGKIPLEIERRKR